jgi:hypothetical protein
MEEYARHEYQQDRARVLKALKELPEDTLRATVTQEPAPGVTDYSLLSRKVAQVNRVDAVTTAAEEWESAHPVVPGE